MVTIVGGGLALAYAHATGRWIGLTSTHLEVLAELGDWTSLVAIVAERPHLRTQLDLVVADLAALGLVTITTADPVAPSAASAPAPVPTTKGVLRRLLRSALVRPLVAGSGDPQTDVLAPTESIEDQGPPSTKPGPSWWSGTGSVPVYSFWATEDGPPMGVASVVAYARVHDGGRLTATYDFRRMTTPAVVLDDLARHDGPAVLLCGNYDWSLAANLAVADRARELCPELVVVHGGPSTPSNPDDCEPFLRSLTGANLAVAGEGEITFAEVLGRLAHTHPDGTVDLDVRRVSGIAGLRHLDPDTGAYQHEMPRVRHDELADFPSPLATGELDLVPVDELNIIPIETNRGCPYSCTFCDWGAATMSRIRQFPMERVRDELDWMARKGVTTWYVADANFGIVSRDVEIAQDIARYRVETGFPEILVAFPAKNATERYLEIIDTFISAGITLKAALALQTRDPATLKAVKRSNIKTESYDRLASESRRRGLPMLTELMIGLPGSTVESFKNDLQWGIDRQVRAFLYPTVVLPNAPMNGADQRELLGIRTIDGRVVATRSFTEADRTQMDRLTDAYHCLEIFGSLRHVLRHLQWDHGRRAIDVVEQILDIADRDPDAYPLVTFHLRHTQNFLLPPVAWPAFYSQAHRLLVDRLDVPDGSGLRTALQVSEHLLSWPHRPLPSTLRLEHDYVEYFRSAQASLLKTGEPDTPDRPLDRYGPGEIEVTADPTGVAELFGRWEEQDPFQQAQDFEPRSPLTAYHSASGELAI